MSGIFMILLILYVLNGITDLENHAIVLDASLRPRVYWVILVIV